MEEKHYYLNTDNKTFLKYGEILGLSPNGVIAYSNNNTNFNPNPNPNPNPNNHIYYNTKRIFTGIKYQCVEYARRYLIYTLNLTFDQIDNAYQIYDLDYFININTNTKVPITKISNCSITKPQKNMLLIYDKFDSEHYETNITGHVAVITKVSDNHIYICEQNWSETKWESNYSRKIPLVKHIKNDITYYTIMEDHIRGCIGFV
jgi:glutathionylspermidine amidase/synthetase